MLKLNLWRTDPRKQFALLEEHITGLRKLPGFHTSHITVFVERNLGFEAHHHKRALGHLPGVTFYTDETHDQVGIWTSNPIKHGMAQLVVLMLSEHRIHVRKTTIMSRDAPAMLLKLREQMEVYSYQFKAAKDTFATDRIAISGKVGGMKDDIAICLQLACYWTQLETQRNSVKKQRTS